MSVMVSSDPLKTLTDGRLDQDLDAWTRQVLRRHFDPQGGAAYWLRRRPEFDFDPLAITRYDELAAFGALDLNVLRDLDPADLVPRSVPRPLAGRVWESGGTTGRPCRVFYTEPMSAHHASWRRIGLEVTGFEPGRTWLYACPSGPHIVGRGAYQIAELYQSTVYTIDLDPRWIKTLIRGSRLAEVQAYIDHVAEQTAEILETGRVDYLETTPALLRALLNWRPQALTELRGVGLGGTQFTPAMYRDFRAALGDDVLIGTTYGNTFGCAIGLPASGDGDILPYVPSYPEVTMQVVDRRDESRVVEVGEVGRVRLTVLHEDLFLPNILERDQAIRFDTGEQWPCDGVANVQPLEASTDKPEGLY